MLFARRTIKIGEELTFNYKMITKETVDDVDDVDHVDVDNSKRQWKCLCNARNCADRIWTEEEKAKRREQKRKREQKKAARQIEKAKEQRSESEKSPTQRKTTRKRKRKKSDEASL